MDGGQWRSHLCYPAVEDLRRRAVAGERAGLANTRFNENNRKDLTADDIRFTTKGKTLYAFVMGWPGKEASIPSLALGGKFEVPKVHHVELLGHKGKLKWRQDSSDLKVELPEQKPAEYAVAFKIALA
jgi:alpha-L-fucosidase